MVKTQPTWTGAVVTSDYYAENLWAFGLKQRGATLDDLVTLAKREPIILLDGRYDLAGGLGRTISRTTLSRRIQDVMKEHHAELLEVAPLMRASILQQYDDQLKRLHSDLAYARGHTEYRVTKKGKRKAYLVIDLMGAARAEKLIADNLAARRKMLGIDVVELIEANVTVTTIDGTSIELEKMIRNAEDRRRRKEKKAEKRAGKAMTDA